MTRVTMQKWPAIASCMIVLTAAVVAQPVHSQRASSGSVPSQRMATLFTAMTRHAPDSLRGLFPRNGQWTYRHSVHTLHGLRRGEWLLPADETLDVVNGPLERVFFLSMHAQPIGRLAHQALHRGTRWRRVSPTRFVPPGATASSLVFVQWRREGEAWVIDTIGDESFGEGVPLPTWCC